MPEMHDDRRDQEPNSKPSCQPNTFQMVVGFYQFIYGACSQKPVTSEIAVL
jgi:hypothetical protein